MFTYNAVITLMIVALTLRFTPKNEWLSALVIGFALLFVAIMAQPIILDAAFGDEASSTAKVYLFLISAVGFVCAKEFVDDMAATIKHRIRTLLDRRKIASA